MEEGRSLKIFLASPSDAGDLRKIVKDTTKQYNMGITPHTFTVVGWEDIPGGIGRPQDIINTLLDECDFLITIFNRRWGSPAGGFWEFTSGTEEEFFRGLRNLARRDRPMKDVWIAFPDETFSDQDHLTQAGDFTRLTEFKHRVEESKSILFHTYNDDASFMRGLKQKLRDWANNTGTSRQKRIHKLLPLSEREYLQATYLIIDGEDLVNRGDIDAGLDKLKDAARIGDSKAKLRYATHLLRQGKHEAARKIAKQALKIVEEDRVQPEYALIELKIAQTFLPHQPLSKTATILQQAMDDLDTSVSSQALARAQILDQLGLLFIQSDASKALMHFNKSFQLRRRHYSHTGEAQSLINCGRAKLRLKRLEEAFDDATQALKKLPQGYFLNLHANAAALASEALYAQGKIDEALNFSQHAVEINTQINHIKGLAIAKLLCSKCLLKIGNIDEARVLAEESLAHNQEISNENGEQKAQELLQQIKSFT